MRKIRYIGGETLGYLLIYSGIARLYFKRRIARGEMTAFVFHNPSAELFKKLMVKARRWGFTFIDEHELLQQMMSGKAPKEPLLFVSVDDGWQNNLKNMAIFSEEARIPVCYFIATEALDSGEFWWCRVQDGRLLEQLKLVSNRERLDRVRQLPAHPMRVAMTRDQLKQLSLFNHAAIGNHTHSHPILPSCSVTELQCELTISHQNLVKITGKAPTVFAYPNGDYDGREAELLRQLGYSMAFTTEPRGITVGETNLYRLPRFGSNENTSGFAENFCRLIGLWEAMYQTLGIGRRECKQM